MTKTCWMGGGAAIAGGPTTAREPVRAAMAAAERIDLECMNGLLEQAQWCEEEAQQESRRARRSAARMEESIP
jgi:hypothetical protein